MNTRAVIKTLGIVLISEAAFMTPSMFVAAINNGSDSSAFLLTIFILLSFGFLMTRIKPSNKHIYTRDGFAIVALGWVAISFFGALPFYFSQVIPSFTDSLFESVSGFTTTGASILTNIEILPKGIIFWRSFTHWIGGMGVLVLTLAILPSVGGRALHIMRAESPGPSTEKLVPKLGHTAKILYIIYFAITLAEVILLMMAGMNLYDALIHAFGSAGTGGFSNKNLSVGAFQNPLIEMIISFFLLLFGMNFALHYQLIKGNWKTVFKDEELRFYFGAIAISIVIITLDIRGNVFPSIWESLRYAIFQVSSIVTTTGFATADFNIWPQLSQFILILLMFLGASAGSTGGAMKAIRILILFKMIKRELARLIHPRSIHAVRIGGKAISEETQSSIMAFFYLYIFVFVFGSIIVSIDRFDMTTTVTAVIATLGNIGPGLGLVGPMGNYSAFSDVSKLTMSLCMIIGRLEVLPILLLFVPSFWKRVNI